MAQEILPSVGPLDPPQAASPAGARAEEQSGGARSPLSVCFSPCVEGESRALVLAQQLVVDSYVYLWQHNVLRPGNSLDGFSPVERIQFMHPIQDPVGAVFCALLMLRRQRHIVELMPDGAMLTYACRRRLAAILHVAHKLSANGGPIDGRWGVMRVIERFLLDEERPSWGVDCERICNEHTALETEVLVLNPMHTIAIDSPMVHLEAELGRLMHAEQMSSASAMRIRGCAFFALGAAMMNSQREVLESLNESLTTEIIGMGVVSALITCLGLTCEPPISYRAPYPDAVDRAARVVLSNMRMKYADVLRLPGSPFMLPVSAEDGSPTRRMLCRATLEQAWRVFHCDRPPSSWV